MAGSPSSPRCSRKLVLKESVIASRRPDGPLCRQHILRTREAHSRRATDSTQTGAGFLANLAVPDPGRTVGPLFRVERGRGDRTVDLFTRPDPC